MTPKTTIAVDWLVSTIIMGKKLAATIDASDTNPVTKKMLPQISTVASNTGRIAAI